MRQPYSYPVWFCLPWDEHQNLGAKQTSRFTQKRRQVLCSMQDPNNLDCHASILIGGDIDAIQALNSPRLHYLATGALPLSLS
tara:strand:- start:802 stop:1050 length:249 start_codon:yes stop_codon:yes gene_type:complete